MPAKKDGYVITSKFIKYRLRTVIDGVETIEDFDSSRSRQRIVTIRRIAAPTKLQEKKRAHARRARGAKKS